MFKKSLLTLIAVFLAIGGRAELSKDTKGNYLIGSAQELSEFTLLVRSGQRAANALLTADIDMSGVTNFIPHRTLLGRGKLQQADLQRNI